jgi:hypothetical protein
VELRSLSMEHTLTTKHAEVFRDLLQRLHNIDKMSVAEKECICCLLLVSKNYNSISSVNVATVPGCQDCIFRILYVSYCLDLDGKYGIDKYDGLVSIEEKREDVIRLNEFFHAWEKVVSKNNHKGNNLLNLVVKEITPDLKYIESKLADGVINKESYIYKRKSIVLQSKYLYYLVSAFFDEHQAESIVCNFHGKEIEITQRSFVHIMHRHLREGFKQFATGKSFIRDERISFLELPLDLKTIIERVGAHVATKDVTAEYIPIRYNGIIYALWIKMKFKHVGRERIPYLHLDTFYPIELSDHLQELSISYKEVMIEVDLAVFLKV